MNVAWPAPPTATPDASVVVPSLKSTVPVGVPVPGDTAATVAVTVTVIASDLVDPNPTSHIISVSSNQPVNGIGDGNTTTDWTVTGPLTLNLLAERTGGSRQTDRSGSRISADDRIRTRADRGQRGRG